MPKSPGQKSDPDANLKEAFVAQVIVGASSLAAIVLLLAQALPPLMRGFP